MTQSAPAGRKLRADASKNRARILEVAELVFAREGVEGAMDAIAKEAGVGPGTLYRHFPTRDALLAELLSTRDYALRASLDAIEAEGGDSAEALERWLAALSEWASAFEGLPEPLREALKGETSPLALTCGGLIDTTESFLASAQRDGLARKDVGGRELFLSVLASVWVSSARLADSSSAPALRSLIKLGWAAEHVR
ncbi:TetR/AcrR family transcriptional regulator [Rhodococcus qingshengii]|uniref:TetR/AcrR family transcriptional regulator n=1 Tax=Rhodococcus qingshengii TaxID=334542 RepID=UPI0010A5B15F|nr:TetR/AcrR family transcriptional regulator [Rhodococcus qingshengii]THJ66909.1 TetR/AcrR family transcriptional regulator [Rhodococcus qingshengii]